MSKALWLADVLRNAGLKVEEVDGWQARGRPGPFGPVKGVIAHHTSGSRKGNAPTLNLVRDGRSDLPGPLSQLVLGRDGTFYVVAAGRCNHAGHGYWQGSSNGNRDFIGIEAENDGRGERWPIAQMQAYAAGCAAILDHIGADEVMVCGHKEWAQPKGRKVDPTFDMLEFRQAVGNIMRGGVANLPADGDPERDMLQKGARGDSVKRLQRALGIAADGDFGPLTEKAVRAFQAQHNLVADGKVGPKTWAALGVK